MPIFPVFYRIGMPAIKIILGICHIGQLVLSLGNDLARKFHNLFLVQPQDVTWIGAEDVLHSHIFILAE